MLMTANKRYIEQTTMIIVDSFKYLSANKARLHFCTNFEYQETVFFNLSTVRREGHEQTLSPMRYFEAASLWLNRRIFSLL